VRDMLDDGQGLEGISGQSHGRLAGASKALPYAVGRRRRLCSMSGSPSIAYDVLAMLMLFV